MEYRTFGRTGLEVSTISLGTEYLINLPQEHVTGVIAEAVDRGVNYFDLFYSQAQFREVMGAAFAGRRDQALLACHLGVVEVDGQHSKTRDMAVSEAVFHDWLRLLRTDHADVLFVHNIDAQEDYDWAMSRLLPQAQALRDQGKARFIGFSGHTVSTSLQAVETGEIDVLMFPVNLTGHAVPGRRELFRACADRDVALVAMKPFAGGRLLRPETSVVVKNHHRGGGIAGDDRYELTEKSAITPVQCLAYVLAQAGVSNIVPGCQSVEELEASLAVLEAGPEERDFAPILPSVSQYVTGECVYCNHCQPCPSHIDVGLTLRLLDEVQGRPTAAQATAYGQLPAPASDCIECGVCTERCPFGVETMDRIGEAARVFEGV